MSINKDNQTEDFNIRFYKLFNPMMGSISNLKKAGHAVSFTTQFVALFIIFRSNMPIEYKILLYIISSIVAFVLSGMIEKGINDFLPFVVTQLIEWHFHNKWFRAMFFMLLVFIILPLLTASPTLSKIGGDEIIKNLIQPDQRPTYTDIELVFESNKSKVDSTINKQKEVITATYMAQKKTLSKKYKSTIQIQLNKYDKYKRLKANGESWASGHMREAKDEIERQTIKWNNELSPIIKQERKELAEMDSLRNDNITYFRLDKDTKIANRQSDWQKKHKEQEAKQKLWGNILGWFAVFGVSATVVCIIIIGIYQKGAEGVKEDDKQADTTGSNKGNFLSNLFEDLGGKISEVLPIGKAANNKPVEAANNSFQKRKQIGFEITNSGKSKAANKTVESGKNTSNLPLSTNLPIPKSGKSKAANKTTKSGNKVADKNRQIIIKSANRLAAKNSGKVTQKDVAANTGLSERTVRTYWPDYKKQKEG